ncbi:hypothetical protein H257_16439 [Aphanomyces astaci]|uniref:Uncharacterized protein n=1 Tax=Aphanomyces astaci TaxID=112090 RepID=W4FIN6_APHAT|nr:hypothetical protein H257_16439 [Aphanomyces astaci]ETV67355.1 hypothetical protein H257_16439 [Aphanomyces astaci]|eukprot:XP_009843170.1 hypothetical protein H257_16439 [Aphanomyces astaci]
MCVSSAYSFKYSFPIHRGKYTFDNQYRNQVYSRNLCVRHGGKGQGSFEGCSVNSRIGSFCTKHGPFDAVVLKPLAGLPLRG